MKPSDYIPSWGTVIKASIFYVMCKFMMSFVPKHYDKGLVIDTDLFSDVDDAGALLLASTHPESNLLAVNINRPSSIYSAKAASNILGYYANYMVPVGLRRPHQNITYFDRDTFEHGEYASKIVHHWQNYSVYDSNEDGRMFWDPVRLYRFTLSRAKSEGVTIVSLGSLDYLSDLLKTPGDEYSDLSGHDLVRTRVKQLVIMGGEYPEGRESNFLQSPSATANVIYKWPGRMVFAGSELGKNVFSGARLMREGSANDPVKAAYQWYNGYNRSRQSWDPLTMLYAIEGSGMMFDHEGTDGHNIIHPDGSNSWMAHRGDYPQSYLSLRVSNETAAARLEELYLQGAARYANRSDPADLRELDRLLGMSD